MTNRRPEIASHVPKPGSKSVRLFGGPWDGREVGVANPLAAVVVINGPRNGDHRVWITHRYELRGGRHEYVGTEVTDIAANAQAHLVAPSDFNSL